jgi:hypothetical protein
MFTSKPFYFSLIRKYIIAFGTLFNNINISKTDSQGNITLIEKVPITYGPKDKMLARVIQDPELDRPTATYPLPMMSFEMMGFNYDGSRKLQTVNYTAHNNPNDNKGRLYEYMPVPYNISFQLNILIKNAEDGTKIVEQILPYFTPDWTLTAILIPEMNIKHDIPIILNKVNLSDVYDGDFKKRRTMIWTLDFTLKGYLYGPVHKAKIIKYTNTELYLPNGTIPSAIGNTSPSALIHVQPGLTGNGKPTSNSSLSIPVNEILATDDFGFVIDINDPLEI